MPSRRHLFSLQFAHALRESVLREPYSLQRFGQDALAGLTVGIIAIPLAMALAIASGVAPQYGLYTAIIAGFLIALAGGSRYSVSGPTAAFVVILYPIAQTWGLGGLLVATMMSGVILVGMALLRLGRLIQYIPESVVLGFTAGIAVVIVTLQLKDLFGLPIEVMPEHFIDKLQVLTEQAGAVHLPSVAVAALTLAVMLLWPRLRTPVPAHLPAILLASLAALLLAGAGHPVETIGSRFSYTLADGSAGAGIPPVLPQLQWPWLREGPGGEPIPWSWQAVQALLPAALAMAMLGAIESLLCAVVLDGMSGKRHSANSELLGGARRHERQAPQRQQRTAGPGPGQYRRALLRRHHRHRCHCPLGREPARRCHESRGCHDSCAGGAAGPGGPEPAAQLPAHGRHGGPVADGGVEHERGAQGRASAAQGTGQ